MELNLLKDLQDRIGFENYADGFGLLEWESTSELAHWSENPEFTARLIPFAQANGSGSFYALWRHDDQADLTALPVVVFGDEGGVHVVARNVQELFQLIGFDSEIMVGWDEVSFWRDSEEPHTAGHAEYTAWLEQHFGLPVAEDPEAVVTTAQAEFGQQFTDWARPFLPI
ncbi:hypothetical protein ACFV16_30695 [Streptomyces massasporeus]|uniref:hypothetical protein n=1 Tax=Streptomyces massasporeus TaxID=67324 RepID=UPI00369E36E2